MKFPTGLALALFPSIQCLPPTTSFQIDPLSLKLWDHILSYTSFLDPTDFKVTPLPLLSRNDCKLAEGFKHYYMCTPQNEIIAAGMDVFLATSGMAEFARATGLLYDPNKDVKAQIIQENKKILSVTAAPEGKVESEQVNGEYWVVNFGGGCPKDSQGMPQESQLVDASKLCVGVKVKNEVK